MSFGVLLKRWRKAKGLTQQELANKARVNISYVSNLERDFSATSRSGTPQPSVELVDTLARILGVNADEARLAAGYAPNNPSGLNLDVADDLRVSLLNGKDYTDEDRAEFEIGLGAAYEALKARIEARKEKE